MTNHYITSTIQHNLSDFNAFVSSYLTVNQKKRAITTPWPYFFAWNGKTHFFLQMVFHGFNAFALRSSVVWSITIACYCIQCMHSVTSFGKIRKIAYFLKWLHSVTSVWKSISSCFVWNIRILLEWEKEWKWSEKNSNEVIRNIFSRKINIKEEWNSL